MQDSEHTKNDGRMEQKGYIGHRQRVKERYMSEGTLSRFTDVQVLEMLLFYALPRRDTKETAQRMIKAFGSFKELLLAKPAEISRRAGVSLNTAVLVAMVGSICSRMGSFDRGPVKLDTVDKIKDCCIALLKGKAQEVFYIICLDNSMNMISATELANGDEVQVQFSAGEMLAQMDRTCVSAAVVTHNHPGGAKIFSVEDIKSTMALRNSLKLYGIKLIDHILVCGDTAISMAENKKFNF